MKFLNRQSLLGLLFAQVGGILLHIERLPIWLTVLSIAIFIWRIQIYRGQWFFPNHMIRSFLVLFSLGAVIVHYSEWYTLEPMVTMLIIAFLLKLLEVQTRRDALVLVFVGYFVTASAYLFDQGIVYTLLGFIVFCLLTACLIVLHGTQSRYLSQRTFKTTSILLLQSVPLMLLMLFVFPRVGALWSVPVKGNSSVTGVSDSMAPGDFSQLTRSRSPAFRIKFDGELPLASQRYWRGVVLTQFDGRRWQRPNLPKDRFSFYKNQPLEKSIKVEADYNTTEAVFNYHIVLEATNTSWLYGIPYAKVMLNDQDSSLNPFVTRSSTNELITIKPVTQRIQYYVRSTMDYSINESPENLRQALLLPEGFNPQTISQAQQWQQETNSTEEYIQRVLAFYNASFFYTLSPPKLGQHTADDFLFSSQRGFCEHFASSFVILMRAAGIPARVVTGYQGGEWNANDEYLLVRQYDAHAWAEVWLPNKGWTRYDPTAAVAPNRIEQGVLDSLSESDQDILDPSLLPSFQWVNRLALEWDGLNYSWQRWVLSYDKEKQSQWLESVLGKITATRMAFLLLAPGLVMLLFFGFMTIRNPKKAAPLKVKLYQHLSSKLKRRGVSLISGESLLRHGQRAEKHLPQHRKLIQGLIKEISYHLYAVSGDIDKTSYQKIKRQINRI